MEIISVNPKGYCQGVVRAINMTKQAAKDPSNMPIYMLGMVVHNRFVVDECRNMGICCLDIDNKEDKLELLEKIPTGTVIFTAHGVSEKVYQKAMSKGLKIVDTTCPDVKKTHALVREHCKVGDVIYIGRHHHPEAEAIAAYSPHVHLVSSVEEVNGLPELNHVLITNQTTLSVLDTRELINACLERFPDAKVMPEICHATTVRQNAVLQLKDKKIDVLFVVGDPHSNNTNQLTALGRKAGIPCCIQIENYSQIDPKMIMTAERIAVTSGSSTPTILTRDVIQVLQNFADTGKWISPSQIKGSIL